jgi:hypothetical protein
MISVEKDTFLIDEPIYVEFKETNIGNVDVLTNRFHCDGPFYSDMLIGPDGKNIGRHGGIRYGLYDKPATGYLLKPSESQYFVIPIHRYYGYSYRGPETNRSVYLPPGKYSFQITHYANDNYLYEKTQAEFSKVKKSIDRMLIVSNELVFYIVNPNAEQEKERLAYLECRRTYGWEKNKEEIIRLYREYFDKYKNSPLFYKYDLMIELEM